MNAKNTPKVEPPNDDLRDKIYQAVAKATQQVNINRGNTTFDEAAKLHNKATDEILALLKLQQEALLNKVQAAIDKTPARINIKHYEDTPMLTRDQVRTTIDTLRLEL